jgi:hypothetical protein
MAEHREARQEQVQASATALTYDVVRFLKRPNEQAQGRTRRSPERKRTSSPNLTKTDPSPRGFRRIKREQLRYDRFMLQGLVEPLNNLCAGRIRVLLSEFFRIRRLQELSPFVGPVASDSCLPNTDEVQWLLKVVMA